MESLVSLFHQGGPVMWPILCCSVLGLALFLERLFHYVRVRRQCELLSDRVLPLAGQEGKRADMVSACEANPSALGRILLAILDRGPQTTDVLRSEASASAGREAVLLERYLGLLNTLATITPLLGLLGTVLGMIEAFRVLAAQGVGTPATLGGGISQALITTAAGLSVAIPLVLLHRYLVGRLERLMLQVDARVQQVIRAVARDQ